MHFLLHTAKGHHRKAITPGDYQRWSASLPFISHVLSCLSGSEYRRDQEERGELDSHEDASPEEVKSREVVLGYTERVGLLLLQFFPNGGATDIVFVTVLHSSSDNNCVVLWSLRNARRTLLFWRQSTAALVFRVGACFEVSLFCPPFPTRPRP